MVSTSQILYALNMGNTSITLTQLTTVKHQRLNTCAQLMWQEHSKATRIFALETALELLAVELPDVRATDRKKGQAFVVVQRREQRTKLKNVTTIVWHWPIDITKVQGDGRQFTCTSAPCTWAMFSTYLSLEELIVLGEAMMRRDKRLRRASPEDFIRYLDAVEQWCSENRDGKGRKKRAFKGMANCRRALNFMREGTDSSQETRTAIALARHGLDGLKVNHAIRNPRTRKRLLLDMALPAPFNVAIEYDGHHHADQWLGDTLRRQDIEQAGWAYEQVTKLNIGDADKELELAQRVAAKMSKSSGNPVTLTPRMTVEQLCDRRRKPRLVFADTTDPGLDTDEEPEFSESDEPRDELDGIA